MGKYAWATDIHLDHIDIDERLVDFAKSLVATEPPGVFITGDISNAQRLVYHLSVIERVVQRPVFFVLGNHDYYGGEIDVVRKSMRDLSNMSQYLKYLPLSSYVALTPSTALVGHDGWYDAYHGDADRSRFTMNDWVMIKDFVPHSGGGKYMRTMGAIKDRAALVAHARKLAHEGVMHVHNGIKSAARYHKNIVVMTHYPPFKESHVYGGRVGDDEAQPWFTSKMMGDMLLDAAKAYPGVNFTVLAGHTHGRYDGKPVSNLEVHVGGADYGRPQLAGLIEVL
jgi:predicted MPP superfamily phosphohydrolase